MMDTGTLLGAMGVAIVAIGGLIAWVVKLILPKVLESFEKRNDIMNDLVKQIPPAINSMEKSIAAGIAGMRESILTVKNDLSVQITDEVDEAKEQIILSVRDSQLKLLADAVGEKVKSEKCKAGKDDAA
jgi:hypothetical protein